MGGNVVGNKSKILKKTLIKNDFYQKFSFLNKLRIFFCFRISFHLFIYL